MCITVIPGVAVPVFKACQSRVRARQLAVPSQTWILDEYSRFYNPSTHTCIEIKSAGAVLASCREGLKVSINLPKIGNILMRRSKRVKYAKILSIKLPLVKSVKSVSKNNDSDLDAWRFDRNSSLLSCGSDVPRQFHRPKRRYNFHHSTLVDGRFCRACYPTKPFKAIVKGESPAGETCQAHEKAERIQAISLVQK